MLPGAVDQQVQESAGAVLQEAPAAQALCPDLPAPITLLAAPGPLRQVLSIQPGYCTDVWNSLSPGQHAYPPLTAASSSTCHNSTATHPEAQTKNLHRHSCCPPLDLTLEQVPPPQPLKQDFAVASGTMPGCLLPRTSQLPSSSRRGQTTAPRSPAAPASFPLHAHLGGLRSSHSLSTSCSLLAEAFGPPAPSTWSLLP